MIDAPRDAWTTVSSRTAVHVILLVIAAAAATGLLGAEMGPAAAAKVILPTLALAIAPGALMTLCWPPRPHLTLLEVIGFGIAISFGLIHLLTILAVTVHAPPLVGLAILGAATVVAALRVLRRGEAAQVVITIDQLIVLGLLVLLALPLYIQGSPFSSYEDQVLVAIVRRLTHLQAPRLDNLYVAPGIVYTYPFPGAHYFMALVARLGDLDPLFLYHKLRFFWGPAAVVMLYLAAREVFGYAAVACAVAVTAVLLICTGVFAMVPGFSWGWGQLAPYSYIPDVAMTVLLPALLVMAFGYLQSETAREKWFFFNGTAMLLLMLIVIHIREVVQFAAYLGCFLVVATLFRALRPYLRRTAALLALTVGLAAVFTLWQGQMFPLVHAIVDEERAELVWPPAASAVRVLFLAPASTVLSDFLQYFDTLFDGLTPFFLLAGTVVVAAFRKRPLVWLLSSSTLAYLAVMTVPILAIPYIYFTYFEILQIPVRNIIFFVYIFAGASVYLAVVCLSRIDRSRLSLVAAGAVGGALAVATTLCLNRSHRGFFLPVIAAYGLTFLYARDRHASRRPEIGRLAAVLVSVLALAALWPDHQPVPRSEDVSVRWISGLTEARRVALERQFSLHDPQPKADRTDEIDVWNYRLTDLSTDNVRRIVTHGDVMDTNGIDRPNFIVPFHPPRNDHPTFGVTHVTWLQYPGLPFLIGTAVAMWALGFLGPALVASRTDAAAVTSFDAALAEPFYRRIVPYALFMIPFLFWSARPTLSPLTLPPMLPPGRAQTPSEMYRRIPCVTTPAMTARFTEHIFPGNDIVLPERTACAPDYAVIQWVTMNIPVDAVFAVDRWDPYPPQVFMPQQAVVFPTLDASFIHEDELFPRYYRFFRERMQKYRLQPFFNSVETPGERRAFVQGLGVTHVLVNPAHYEEMRAVLDPLPGQFTLRYSDGKWAVYEAMRNGG